MEHNFLKYLKCHGIISYQRRKERQRLTFFNLPFNQIYVCKGVQSMEHEENIKHTNTIYFNFPHSNYLIL